MSEQDVFRHNQRAWDHQVRVGNRWTQPVDPEAVARARDGELSRLLTPNRPVPPERPPSPLRGTRILCLAGGGGQQGPLLAAAGAVVTVVDASEGQLGQDRKVAEREGLTLTTVQADMADLSAFETASFDLVFHPVSNLFVADVRPVWREAARGLRRGGGVLAGFVNPPYFLFRHGAPGPGELVVRYRIPYADPEQLDSASLDALMAQNEPLCFGHSLTDQIGGQLDAGLAMIGLYEDRWEDKAIDDLIATFVATRSRKL